jgi:hypothetical protein
VRVVHHAPELERIATGTDGRAGDTSRDGFSLLVYVSTAYGRLPPGDTYESPFLAAAQPDVSANRLWIAYGAGICRPINSI